jgi:ABC-type polysaccharide/polyol phosphate export permease
MWQVFGFGLGLGLSTVNVFFRDVTQILAVLLQVWMWSLPIVYFEDILPPSMQTIVRLNPAYPFVTLLRDNVLAVDLPGWLWVAMVGWSAAAVGFGWVILRGLRAELRDVL